MTQKTQPRTALSTHTADAIYVRDLNLCDELIGKVNFTQMLFFDILGRMPNETEMAIIDAVLVTLMEHGLTPSAIATRLVYTSAPEALQGAVSAGLLAAGSMMLGTLETSARLLDKIVNDPEGVEAAARREARIFKTKRRPVPGFGHPHHKPDDPRTIKLFELARSLNVPGRHIIACEGLSKAIDEEFGKHLTVNASAAIGALLCEINIPFDIMRGFAVICRAAGLVAHVYEEQKETTAWIMTKAADEAIPYSGNMPPKNRS